LKRRYRQSICRPKTREGSRSRQDSAACVSLSSVFKFSKSKPATATRANPLRLAFETTGLPPGSPGREPRFREEQCPSRAGEAPWRPDKDRINTNPGPVSTTDFRFSFEFRRLRRNVLIYNGKHSYPQSDCQQRRGVAALLGSPLAPLRRLATRLVPYRGQKGAN
jgi:hypothetical protein